MKQGIFAILLTAVLLSLSVTAHAQTAPGCAPEMLETQSNRSDALRVRDRAYQREVVKRTDPSLGMTCFDQALGVTARLGNIFSDRFPYDVPAPDTNVFTPPLAYPRWGADEILLDELDRVVMPVLTNYVDDFGGALSEILGTTLVTDLYSAILSPISAIQAAVDSFASDIAAIQTAINTILTIANTLSLPLPSATIIAIVAALKAAQSFAQSLIDALISAMNALVKPLIDALMAVIMGPATDIDCDRMAQLWNDGDPFGGAASIQGNGIEDGVPYMTIAELLSGAVPGGPDFMQELSNTFNVTILTDAANDLTGALAGPGSMPSWQTVPFFPVGTGTAAIISAM